MGFVIFKNGVYSSPFIEFPMLYVRNPLGAMFVDHKLPSFEDLPELKEDLSHVMSNLNANFPNEIKEILSIYLSLDNLPDSSTLKVLGYFPDIEGLLSHAPQPSNSMDSIHRQLKRNINLLNNRLKKLGREIDFSSFGDTNHKKIIEKLYGYRSSIAYGEKIESPLSNIDKIRRGNVNTDHLWVHDWLREMTKKLLLASIIETELVLDLK